MIGAFAVAILLFLSNFHLCGVLGEALRSLQLGIFGMVGFLVPLALFAGTCFYLSNRGNFHAHLKLVAVIAALITICGLLQLFFGSVPEGAVLTEYYLQSSKTGLGGGLLGGALTSLLILAVGWAGAFLILLAVFILCMVCITERSFVSAVKKGSGKAYQYAREDMDRRRELYARRSEERRLLREEQKVRGVNLEATRLTGSGSWEEEAFEEEFGLEAETAAASENGAEASETLDPPRQSGPEDSPSPADVFTGKFDPLPDYGEEETDPAVVHMTAKEVFAGPAEEAAETDGAYSPSQPEPDGWEDAETLAAPAAIQEEQADEQTPPWTDSVFVPEAPKRVVTASGKVIETETELLEKKVESRRREEAAAAARTEAEKEETDTSVAREIQKKENEEKKEYIFPPTTLLKKGKRAAVFQEEEYKATAIKLQQTLHNFGVGVTVTNISCGPAVTRYELLPEQGVKVSRIVGLADDIKLSLAAADIRIEAPIPGKSAVGIEVPNKENNIVHLRELLEAESFTGHKSRLAFAVGKDLGGQVVVTDIARMPHLLIAGATGSGKSVCINTLIMSIIYKSKPEDVKLIMIDPKVVELSVYNGIPHLLIPVVTDPKKASGALNWAVAEMTDRYKKFAECNVRDLKGYNERISQIEDIEEEAKPARLPQIVIIIDELADLMMVAPGEVEDAICRLAQLARAAGIHLVIATQRPSVNVITGLIKANVPSRIAFAVSSGVDSRTIIDMNGAEKLLGKGDMLFYPAGFPKPQRVQGAFVSDEEVGRVVEFLTEQGMTAQYSQEVESRMSAPAASSGGDSGRDEYFVQAGQFIIEKDKASIGMLQRMFKIGFNRAARVMDQLAQAGVVGEEEGTKPRKILMTQEEFEAFLKQNSF